MSSDSDDGGCAQRAAKFCVTIGLVSALVGWAVNYYLPTRPTPPAPAGVVPVVPVGPTSAWADLRRVQDEAAARLAGDETYRDLVAQDLAAERAFDALSAPGSNAGGPDLQRAQSELELADKRRQAFRDSFMAGDASLTAARAAVDRTLRPAAPPPPRPPAAPLVSAAVPPDDAATDQEAWVSAATDVDQQDAQAESALVADRDATAVEYHAQLDHLQSLGIGGLFTDVDALKLKVDMLNDKLRWQNARLMALIDARRDNDRLLHQLAPRLPPAQRTLMWHDLKTVTAVHPSPVTTLAAFPATRCGALQPVSDHLSWPVIHQRVVQEEQRRHAEAHRGTSVGRGAGAGGGGGGHPSAHHAEQRPAPHPGPPPEPHPAPRAAPAGGGGGKPGHR